MTSKPAPATQLEGLELKGWKVIKRVERYEGATGGYFSCSYVVEKNGQSGFLKAFDFSQAFAAENVLDELKRLTTSYTFERDILLHCNEKRLTKVVLALEHGEIQIPNYDQINGLVYYLIFQLADGDVRGRVRDDARFDARWSIKVLKDVTVGTRQVHLQLIAHQDLKPSNVLLFDQEARLADFGRASRKGYIAPHDDFEVAGDRIYSPPEHLYGYNHPDFTVRRFGCDLYMLGNLASFLFSGINITSQIMAHLPSQFHWHKWAGEYKEILPYLMNAYYTVIDEIKSEIDEDIIPEIIPVIEELCHPNIFKRGMPKWIGHNSQYSLERYVSRIDFIRLNVERRLRRTGNVS